MLLTLKAKLSTVCSRLVSQTSCFKKHLSDFAVMEQQMIILIADDVLGTKSGVGKLLKDDFPYLVLWHCLN